ncbi:MAG: type II toxin-antitoxin system prevent-host-death family antitoxin [Luteitalea sp.]|nr:type II toxin-antitoxin system prevent-host-death family antitoxin [Luteitalea sp.]
MAKEPLIPVTPSSSIETFFKPTDIARCQFGRCSARIVTAEAPLSRSRLTFIQLSYKMSDMQKTTSVSIRELQQNLKRVLARVERGQVIEVTRRRRPVARLAPMRSGSPTSPWPDLDARVRAVFGKRVVTPGAADAVSEGRGDR